jgi:hypothetical protein
MGYTTDFFGKFTLDRVADSETQRLLRGLSSTRRMKRKVDEKKYGIEGEFYFKGKGFAGQDHEDNIIDYNFPPRTQPSLWCQWQLQEDNKTICWDEGEKFYNYIEWIGYIIEKILKKRAYVLNGEVEWHGEEYNDLGKIIVKNNEVTVKIGKITFE